MSLEPLLLIYILLYAYYINSPVRVVISLQLWKAIFEWSEKF